MNIATLVDIKAKKRGNHRILFYRDSDSHWVGITWSELLESVRALSQAFVAMGIEPADTIGIITQNTPKATMVDFATYANRAVAVPMHATLSPSQIQHILQDARIKIMFVGGQQQYDALLEAMQADNCVEKIVAFSDDIDLRGNEKAVYLQEFMEFGKQHEDKLSIVHERQRAVVKDDLLNLIYTSGTTGVSKGVMITHENIDEAMRIHKIRVKVSRGARSLAFLPMSHIFERLWIYYCLFGDVKVYMNYQPTEIQQAIREVRPHYMCSVPRFWEKVSIGVRQKIEEFPPFKKALVAWALAIGEEYNLKHKRIGKKPSLSLSLRYQIANNLIFSKLKKVVGIDHGQIFPVAGASMSDKQVAFFRALGIPIVYGYGLTETSATVSCFPVENYTIGSVGAVMPDVNVRIGEDGEIQIKAKTITPGYYNMPEEIAEAFVDGWFRTGDMGKIEGDTLYMTDRLKDMFKTSNGKYISPQSIEIALTQDPFIEQVAVIGNNRNYVTAIISPSVALLKEFAEKNDIKYELIDDILRSEKVQKLFERKIDELQKDFAPFEKIKKFRLIKRQFSIESGELTTTLKLKRAVIQQNYSALIEEMYSE